MASIHARINKNGTKTWRVFFRRKGLPSHHIAVSSEKEAESLASLEEEYIFNYKSFVKKLPNPLQERRKREFLKKKLNRKD